MKHILNCGLLGTNGAASYAFQAPFGCVVTDAYVTAQNSDIGDADTVTIKKSTTTVGVATFGSTIAAFAKATYVPDSTSGNTAYAAGDNILVDVSALDAAGDRVNVTLVLDPYAIGQAL